MISHVPTAISNLLLRSEASRSCHRAQLCESSVAVVSQCSSANILTYEVDTDGGDVGLCVGVVGESQKKARLSNTGVTDEEKLEEIIVSVNIGGQFRLRELVVEYLP